MVQSILNVSKDRLVSLFMFKICSAIFSFQLKIIKFHPMSVPIDIEFYNQRKVVDIN